MFALLSSSSSSSHSSSEYAYRFLARLGFVILRVGVPRAVKDGHTKSSSGVASVVLIWMLSSSSRSSVMADARSTRCKYQ